MPASAAIVYHSGGLIYVMDRDGGNPTPLTAVPQTFEHVAVSPGRRYAGANVITPDGHSQLWVYDLTGPVAGGVQLVQSFVSAGPGGVDWDSAGFLYFAGQAVPPGVPVPPPTTPQEMLKWMLGSFSVYKIRPDGSRLAAVTQPGIGAADVRVSRSSPMVSFTTAASGEGGVVQVYVVNTDGTGLRPVPGVNGHDPQLSPDGRRLLFTRPGPLGNQQVWVVNADGTAPAQVTPDAEWALAPDWDGTATAALYTAVKDAVLINLDGTGRALIKAGALVAKWIPN